jgi:hypothetical protein
VDIHAVEAEADDAVFADVRRDITLGQVVQ